jgi:hypothetical protein
MRAQAMFEPALRPTVTDLDRQLEDMIWRVVVAYAALAGKTTAVPSLTAYAVFDGLFENCLSRHLAGDASAADQLREGAGWLITTVTKA